MTPHLAFIFYFLLKAGTQSITEFFELAVFLEDDLGLLVFPSARITGLVNTVLGMETRASCMLGKHAVN